MHWSKLCAIFCNTNQLLVASCELVLNFIGMVSLLGFYLKYQKVET